MDKYEAKNECREPLRYFKQINRIDPLVFTVHHFSKQPDSLSLNKLFQNGEPLNVFKEFFKSQTHSFYKNFIYYI